jgi:hypothetical protein
VKGVLYAYGPVAAARWAGAHLALGGSGLAGLIIRFFIWHEIWRLVRFLWRIPTYGPFLVILLALILVGLLVWRQQRGQLRFRRRGRNGSGSAGYGSGSGPRDW